jgi:catechol 2,3-dioxygenase-like lactoylglutathione lyase family enzyme
MTESTTVVRGIDASYYMTKDLTAATKYYNDLLGREPDVHVPGLFSEYSFADGSSFGLYMSENFYQSGTILFRVDDVPDFVAAAKAKGVSFAGDGHVDDTPNCHMAFGTDPDGNQFIIHKVK